MAYTFPAAGVLLPPMINDVPPTWSPTDMDWDNYLLQRYWQDQAFRANQSAAN